MREVIGHIGRFVVLILLQALILQNIELGSLSSYFNPFLYILFIMMLPFDLPTWAVLTLSCILGFTLDLFTETLGMHASACVLIAFLRPWVLKLLASRDEYEFRNKPNIHVMGFSWSLYYGFLMALIHHFWFYFIEDFRLIDLHIIILKALCSAIFTTALIICAQYLTNKHRKENG